MSEQRFNIPVNGKYTLYLSQEEWKYLHENYEIIVGSEEPMPVNRLIMACITKAASNMRPDSNPKDIEELNKLRKEVEFLNQAIGDLNRENKLLSEQLAESKNQLTSGSEQTLEEIASLKKALEAEKAVTTLQKQSIEDQKATIENLRGRMPDHSVIVILTDSQQKVIHHICSLESERTKSEVTPELLLKNVFFHILVNGPHDVFSVPVSISKIRELSKQ